MNGVYKSHSPVLTTKGLVGSASPLAGSIGAQVMREGGNAFDAAVAVAAAEAVTLPMMCGLGGEVFALLYHAKSNKIYGISGSGRAPLGATREYFVDLGYVKMPPDGPLTPAVPGEVHAWQTILDKFGTKSLSDLLQPAIDLAENGFPLPVRSASYFVKPFYDKLAKYPSTKKIFIKGDGSPYELGDVLIQRNLADSLRRIAEGGPDEFYKGALAKELAKAIIESGGLIDESDLANQETMLYENPPSIEFHGHTVYATDLPSQGVLTLEILSILDGFDLAKMGHNTPESIHTMIEAKRLAFADRLAYVGDPEFVKVPMEELLSKEYAASRRDRIDPQSMAEIVPAGELLNSASPNPSTSYFNVIDSEGNALSFIHSLSQYFGSGFVAGDTGILLNDRAGRGFYLDEGHVNVIAPGKKTINTIHTYMVFKDDKPVLVGGTPGGDNQPQWNAQTISNVIDHDMDVQEAADAPRWAHFPGTDPRTIDEEMVLRMEEGFSSSIRSEIEEKGHKIVEYPLVGTPGAVQLIGIDHARGVHAGGTDRRSDGYPIPE